MGKLTQRLKDKEKDKEPSSSANPGKFFYYPTWFRSPKNNGRNIVFVFTDVYITFNNQLYCILSLLSLSISFLTLYNSNILPGIEAGICRKWYSVSGCTLFSSTDRDKQCCLT